VYFSKRNTLKSTRIHLMTNTSARRLFHRPLLCWQSLFLIITKQRKVDATMEELKLVESIAAVRMGGHAAGDHINGVVVLIPAGQVIRFQRTTPLLDQMLPVKWNGSSYGVFLEDLLEHAGQVVSHREDNPGIVPIHPA
jgi:hypothetical protein